MSDEFFFVPETAYHRRGARDLAVLSDPAIAWPDDEERRAELRRRYLYELDARILPVKPGRSLVLFSCGAVAAVTSDQISARAHGAAYADGHAPGSLGYQMAYSMLSSLEYYRRGCLSVRGVASQREGKPTGELVELTTEEERAEVPEVHRYEIGNYVRRLSTEFVPGFCVPARR